MIWLGIYYVTEKLVIDHFLIKSSLILGTLESHLPPLPATHTPLQARTTGLRLASSHFITFIQTTYDTHTIHNGIIIPFSL